MKISYKSLAISTNTMLKYVAPPDWSGKAFSDKINILMLCVDGECIVSADGSHYIVTPGTMILFPQGHNLVKRFTNLCRFTYYQCHFTADLDGVPAIRLLNLDNDNLAVSVPDFDHVVSLFESGIRDSVLSDSNAISINRRAVVLRLFSEYIELRRKNVPGKNAPYFSVVTEYMQNNLSKPVSVADLCNIIHLAPSYFTRRFSECFGCPPLKYFDKLRMQRAMEMLTNPDIAIEDVSKSIGIENKYYFNRFFEKHAHITPKKYRDVFETYDF